MRLSMLFFMALMVASPAMANDPPPKQEVTSTAATTPAPTREKLTLKQRFERANTTHDGRLTLEQARLGYKSVAGAFDKIDATGKGFVTIEDIRAWRKAQQVARKAARTALNDPLRPRHALQRTPAEESRQAMTTPARGPARDGSADTAGDEVTPAQPDGR